MDKEPSLTSGSSCFLIKDASLKNADAEFYQWLRRNGFHKWKIGHGHYGGVDWVYVNLNYNLYNPGMPGVPLAEPIGHHAITIEEFMTVFRIFKKYEGKLPLEL